MYSLIAHSLTHKCIHTHTIHSCSFLPVLNPWNVSSSLPGLHQHQHHHTCLQHWDAHSSHSCNSFLTLALHTRSFNGSCIWLPAPSRSLSSTQQKHSCSQNHSTSWTALGVCWPGASFRVRAPVADYTLQVLDTQRRRSVSHDTGSGCYAYASPPKVSDMA